MTPLQCCSNQPILDVTYDVGTEGERNYLVCAVCIKKKPFRQHIKSQKPISSIENHRMKEVT